MYNSSFDVKNRAAVHETAPLFQTDGLSTKVALDPAATQLPPNFKSDSPEDLLKFGDIEKGEFETTQQFEQRITNVRGGMQRMLTFDVQEDFLRYRLKYDADAQIFRVEVEEEPSARDGLTEIENRHLLRLQRTILKVDSYTGQNAFGATREVARGEWTEFFIDQIDLPGD